MQKGGNFSASPRGCDLALRATRLCHVDACECLRGTEVTCHLHIYFMYIGYRTYKPFHRGISVTYKTDSPYISDILLNLLRVGLFVFVLFCFRATWQHSARWIKIAMNYERGCGGREVHLIKDQARAAIFTSVS